MRQIPIRRALKIPLRIRKKQSEVSYRSRARQPTHTPRPLPSRCLVSRGAYPDCHRTVGLKTHPLLPGALLVRAQGFGSSLRNTHALDEDERICSQNTHTARHLPRCHGAYSCGEYPFPRPQDGGGTDEAGEYPFPRRGGGVFDLPAFLQDRTTCYRTTHVLSTGIVPTPTIPLSWRRNNRARISSGSGSLLDPIATDDGREGHTR